MQVVGHHAIGFALDADAVLVAAGHCRERIVAAHFFATDEQLQTNVLTRGKPENRPIIRRLQIERSDLGTFIHPVYQLELTRTAPAANGFGFFVVDRALGTDQNIGQLLIRMGPGLQYFVSGNVASQHFGDGADQAGADDRVMLRQDLQSDVLVDDFRHQIAQLLQFVDVPCVHQYTVGQRAGLITAGLMRLVKQRAHLWVFLEHHFVEMSGQRFSTAFKQGHGGFDDGTILSVQHDWTPEPQGF